MEHVETVGSASSPPSLLATVIGGFNVSNVLAVITALITLDMPVDDIVVALQDLRSVEGYAKALTEFDERMPEIIDMLKDDDILMITADHGCDPITPSTDHSREYTPLVMYGKNIKAGVNLGTRKSFADIAATILEYFNLKDDIAGTSMLNEIIK